MVLVSAADGGSGHCTYHKIYGSKGKVTGSEIFQSLIEFNPAALNRVPCT